MLRLFLISLLFFSTSFSFAKEGNPAPNKKKEALVASSNALGIATWRDISRLEAKISLPDGENKITQNRALIALDKSGAYAEILAFSNGSILYKQDKNYAGIPATNNHKQREQALIRILSLEKKLKALDIKQLSNFKHISSLNKEDNRSYLLSTAEANSNKASCQFFFKALLPSNNSYVAQRARGVFCFPQKNESSMRLVSEIANKLVFDGGAYAHSQVTDGITRKVHTYWSSIDSTPPAIKLSKSEFTASGVLVSGNVSDDSSIGFIKIAGERLSDTAFSHVLNKSNGDFSIFVKSQRKISQASISIGDKYGNTATKQITNKVVTLSSSNQSPIVFKAAPKGKTYALLVGVSSYKLKGLTTLVSPPHDIKLIENTLKSSVGVPSNQIIVLKNPSKQKFISTLNGLRKNTLSFGDQLVLYFSGHGSETKDPSTGKKFGYWLFSDTTSNPKSWLSNQEIKNIFSGFSDGGVMLIADSCFSGNFIAKTFSDVDQLDLSASEKSGTAFTAAGDSPTPDIERQLNSAFALAVNQSLKAWVKRVRSVGKSTIPGFVVFSNALGTLEKKGQQTPHYGSFFSPDGGKPKEFLLETKKR